MSKRPLPRLSVGAALAVALGALVGCSASPDAADRGEIATASSAVDDPAVDAPPERPALRTTMNAAIARPFADTTTRACTSDSDCAGQDLCIAGTCFQSCLDRDPTECANGVACVYAVPPGGGCYREHGCNPAPEGTMCPAMCRGYCPQP